jgi:hypothetical protein
MGMRIGDGIGIERERIRDLQRDPGQSSVVKQKTEGKKNS